MAGFQGGIEVGMSVDKGLQSVDQSPALTIDAVFENQGIGTGSEGLRYG